MYKTIRMEQDTTGAGGMADFKSPKETIYSLKIWSFKLMTQGTN